MLNRKVGEQVDPRVNQEEEEEVRNGCAVHPQQSDFIEKKIAN